MAPSIIREIETDSRTAMLKRSIVSYFLHYGFATISDLSKSHGLSVPTVSKVIDQMMNRGYIVECGKLETSGGRHPSLYGLNPEACYFAGVDINSNSISLAVMNLSGDIVAKMLDVPYEFENNSTGLDRLCKIICSFINSLDIPASSIVNMNVNFTGRVNPKIGFSYSRFNFSELPLSDVIASKTGLHTCIENDTRAMTYGEYICGQNSEVRNMIFVNCSWGLGIGMVINGKVYSGKSGFAGEFGHVSFYDNEVLCHCGKKGCLETEASGSALRRKLIERLDSGANSVLADSYKRNGDITLNEILDAVSREDVLCIEMVEEVGRALGRGISGLINIFNPEKVVIGGSLSTTGDYLLSPLRTAVKMYSLNLVSKDTTIELSELGNSAGLIGACLIARMRAFNDSNE